MTLELHRAERADALADALADILRQPLPDAFATEIVAVPARGVERWLTQRLSHTLGATDAEAGICAGVRFPSPTALAAELLGVDEHDPWAPDSLVWPVLAVIDEHRDEEWCTTLARHLGAGLPPNEARQRAGRRFAVARRLAGLFDAYATTRPSLIAAWADGRDEDGFGAPLAPDLAWQATLWRLARDRIDAPDPVERVRTLATTLRTGGAQPEAVSALPARLSVFGPTRLPVAHLEVLSALAIDRDVHVWIPHPSPALWDALAAVAPAGSGAAPALAPPRPRRTDPAAQVATHPLLASLGRDVRELQEVMAGLAATSRWHPPVAASDQIGLLTELQRDLRDDRRRTPQERTLLDSGDRSVVVHSCHGPTRQVEVLREELVGLLAADPTLEPRDILVMCPDVEVYAPLISAAFGLAEVVDRGHPGHELRVRLADRALRRTNPLLATVSRLLALADGRVTASQVLDLAARGPVRRRFGFGDDELERVSGWAVAANVRWGLDTTQRAAYGLTRFPQNTWRAGLDRLLAGAAMSESGDTMLGTVLPLDDVGSNDIELVGRLAEFLDRLERALQALHGPQPLAAWLNAIEDAVAALTHVGGADGWQRAELQAELSHVREAAGDAASRTPLTLAELDALLGGRLGGRPTRANFRTGTLTVCTMVPMRSVPHRVICLLGMDDGVYPRSARIDGDDVLARTPAVGERDARGEDRQLLLDALLAATERVVITYSGHDERTGQPRPPAVPLGELLDALDDTAVTASGEPARAQVVTEHPLQPYDARTFTPGALGVPRPFGYDPTGLAAARAAARPRRPAPPFLAEPLRPLDDGVVDFARLTETITHPVRAFLKHRLEIGLPYEDDEPADALAVELDALQKWGVGERILHDRLAGLDAATSEALEWRRGHLPPGPLGRRTLHQALREVEPLVDGTAELRATPARTVDITVALPTGREIRGTVGGVHDRTVLSVGYSRLGARARLHAWLHLLALAAAHTDEPWTAAAVGRGRGRQPYRICMLGPIDEQTAVTTLAQLVDIYDRAMTEPLPVMLKTSEAYAARRATGQDVGLAQNAAAKEWATDRFDGEDADAGVITVWGTGADLEILLDPDPRPDEHWFPDELTRFGQLARRIWTPLIAAEAAQP